MPRGCCRDAGSSRTRGCSEQQDRGLQGCSEPQEQGLCKHNISLHRFTGCCQRRHRSCSNPFLPSPSPAGRGSPFPGRKFLVKAAKRRSLSSPARTLVHCRDVYTLCSALQTGVTLAQHPSHPSELGRLWEGSREAPRGLQRCWVIQPWPWMSGGCALQPPSLPAAQPSSETPSGGSSLPFSCWFRISFHPDSGWYSAWLSPSDGM